MVKKSLLLMSMIAIVDFPVVATDATILQVSTLEGKGLDYSIVDRLPRRDSKTRQSVFLGSLRANIEGDINDAAYHFDDALRAKTIGSADLAAITARQKRNLKMNASEIRSMWRTFVFYSEIQSNNLYRCSGTILSNSPRGIETNVLTLIEYQTNAIWRVSDFLIDGISITDE